jgi:FkbM family methyltransferase
MLNSLKYYYSMFGINGVVSAIKAKLPGLDTFMMKVDRDDIKFPFYLRFNTSDVPTFDQIFMAQEYDFKVKSPPKIIVDAGANIGLTSILFANRYPEAKIIAIEPETSNYEMLKMNVAPYSNIFPMKVALWNENDEINLVDPGFGKWGFMTQGVEYEGDVTHKVKSLTVDKIMEDNGIDKIDILKIDIEGAEREVFMNSSSWIKNVDSLIVELHERMKAGCNRSFYNASNGFDEEWQHGENIYLSRANYLTRGSA